MKITLTLLILFFLKITFGQTEFDTLKMEACQAEAQLAYQENNFIFLVDFESFRKHLNDSLFYLSKNEKNVLKKVLNHFEVQENIGLKSIQDKGKHILSKSEYKLFKKHLMIVFRSFFVDSCTIIYDLKRQKYINVLYKKSRVKRLSIGKNLIIKYFTSDSKLIYKSKYFIDRWKW